MTFDIFFFDFNNPFCGYSNSFIEQARLIGIMDIHIDQGPMKINRIINDFSLFFSFKSLFGVWFYFLA